MRSFFCSADVSKREEEWGGVVERVGGRSSSEMVPVTHKRRRFPRERERERVSSCIHRIVQELRWVLLLAEASNVRRN